MGNSSSTRNMIRNSITMQTMQKYVDTNILTTQTNTTNLNYADVNILNGEGCPISIKQSVFNAIRVNQDLDEESIQDLQNSLSTDLQNTATQNAELINGAFNITGGNNTTAVNDVRNNIDVVVKNEITKTKIQKIVNDSFNQNSGKVTMLFCRNSPISVDQSIVSNVISQNILHTLGQALSKNDVISTVITEADQKAKQQNQGLNDIIDSIGKAITGPVGISIGGLILCCCIIIIAVIVLGMSPAGQNAGKKLAAKYT